MAIFRTESANSTTWRSLLELPERYILLKPYLPEGFPQTTHAIMPLTYEKSAIPELIYRLPVKVFVKNYYAEHEVLDMTTKQTIKSLLALTLTMLVGLFSLQPFADEAEPVKSTDYEQLEIDEDAMIPDEELLDEEADQNSEEAEKKQADKPLSHADEVEGDSDSDEDTDQPESSNWMLG